MSRGFGATVLPVVALAVGAWTLLPAGAGCAQAESDDNVPPGCPTPSPRCGDGCVDTRLGETCDDGNRLPGDGCGADCQRESGTDAGDTTPRDDGTTLDDGTTPRDDGTTPPDDGGTDTSSCPEAPCRLWPQCGCPAGQKCTLDATSTETRLVRACGAAGSGTTSSLCTVDDDCGVGTGCFGLFSETGTATMGMCYQYCAGAADCSGVGSVCVSLLTTASTPGTCSHACNIMTNSGCPSGTKCMPLTLGDTGTLLTDCTSDLGYGSAGSFCLEEADCGPGTFCGSAGGIDECLAYCSNPPLGSCPGFRTCTSFTTRFVLGGTEYGYCR